LTSERPDILGPGVAVDRGEVDAEASAILIAPLALHDECEIALAIRVRDMAIDNAVVDNVTAILLAEADKLPFYTVALAVDAQHEQQRARRYGSADIKRLRRSIAQLLPWRRLGGGLVGDAGRVGDKGLLGARVAARPEPLLGYLGPTLQYAIG